MYTFYFGAHFWGKLLNGASQLYGLCLIRLNASAIDTLYSYYMYVSGSTYRFFIIPTTKRSLNLYKTEDKNQNQNLNIFSPKLEHCWRIRWLKIKWIDKLILQEVAPTFSSCGLIRGHLMVWFFEKLRINAFHKKKNKI